MLRAIHLSRAPCGEIHIRSRSVDRIVKIPSDFCISEDSANDIVSRGIRDYPRISVYHFVLMILKCLTFEVGIEVESNANIEQLNCSISYDSEKNLFRYKRNTIRIMIINKFVHVNFSRLFGIN